MDDKQMREAWERSGLAPTHTNRKAFAAAWQAAYAAGMERAAEICEAKRQEYSLRRADSGFPEDSAEACAEAIRAEIPK